MLSPIVGQSHGRHVIVFDVCGTRGLPPALKCSVSKWFVRYRTCVAAYRAMALVWKPSSAPPFDYRAASTDTYRIQRSCPRSALLA